MSPLGDSHDDFYAKDVVDSLVELIGRDALSHDPIVRLVVSRLERDLRDLRELRPLDSEKAASLVVESLCLGIKALSEHNRALMSDVVKIACSRPMGPIVIGKGEL